MEIKASTPEQYLDALPEDRKPAFSRLRQLIREHLPEGFEETMSYGMIGYVVPHSIFPAGYHCDPRSPLPFISIASQKNFIAVYHSGIYADQALLDWFVNEYPKHSNTKLDMGKSCIRFKKINDIPYDLIAELAEKMTPAQWVEKYQAALKK